MRVARLSLTVLTVGGGIVAQMGAAGAPTLKVAPNPVSGNVTEGQSYDVDFQLNAPIINPITSPDPNVTLTFTPQDPSRLSFSPPTIEWTPSEWFQVRTLQVTAIHDGIHDASNVDVVQVTTTADAEYYSGFTTSFTVNITDIDPGPPTTTTTTPPTTTTTAAPTTTALGAGTTIVPTSTSTSSTPTRSSTTRISVAPDTGSLPTTGVPIEDAVFAGSTFVAAGLLLIRPKHRGARRRWHRD